MESNEEQTMTIIAWVSIEQDGSAVVQYNPVYDLKEWLAVWNS
jgi:hypothetical protein